MQHKFGQELSQFCTSQDLLLTDVMRYPRSTYTYYYDSEAHCTVSWLDHIMCTQSAHDLVENVSVMYKTVSSDHDPISVFISLEQVH